MKKRIVVKTVDGISHEVDIPAHNECYFKDRVFNDIESIYKVIEIVEKIQTYMDDCSDTGFGRCLILSNSIRRFLKTCSIKVEEENAES